MAKDIYDNLEVEQIRRNQRGLRPMTAVGGFVEGYQESKLAALREQILEAEYKRKVEESRDKAIRQNRDNKSQYEKELLGYEAARKMGVNARKPEALPDVSVPDEYKERKTLGQHAFDKAKEVGGDLFEKFGGFIKGLGVSAQEGESPTSATQPSVPSGGLNTTDAPAQEEQSQGSGVSEPPSDGYIMQRGLRAADGVYADEEAMANAAPAEESGFDPSSAMGVSEGGAGADSPTSTSRGVQLSSKTKTVKNSKANVPETPFETLQKKAPEEAKKILNLGQSPEKFFEHIDTMRELAINQRMVNYQSDEYKDGKNSVAGYLSAHRILEEQGVYQALRMAENGDKKAAMEILSKRSGDKILDIQPYEMKWKGEDGSTFTYKNYRVKSENGTTTFDTRNMYIQQMSLEKLLTMEDKWADNMQKERDRQTNEELRRMAISEKADSKNERKEAADEKLISTVFDRASKKIESIGNTDYKNRKIVGATGSMAAIMGAANDSVSEANSIIGKMAAEAKARLGEELADLRAKKGVTAQQIDEWQGRAGSRYEQILKDVTADWQLATKSKYISEASADVLRNARVDLDNLSPGDFESKRQSIQNVLLKTYKAKRSSINAMIGKPIGDNSPETQAAAIEYLTDGRFTMNGARLVQK